MSACYIFSAINTAAVFSLDQIRSFFLAIPRFFLQKTSLGIIVNNCKLQSRLYGKTKKNQVDFQFTMHNIKKLYFGEIKISFKELRH